jgi:hypothetical protein
MSCDVTRDPTRIAGEATRHLTRDPTAHTISQTPSATDASPPRLPVPPHPPLRYPGNMTALPDIARATAAEHAMLPPATPVVAMVSGGADSMALLHLLATTDLGDNLHLSVCT